MVVRAWLIVGALVIGVAWYLIVFAPLPEVQATAASALDSYRRAGVIPAANALKQSTAIGHEVFELPKSDAEHLKEEQAAQMTGMPAMAIPGTTTGGQGSGGEQAMPGMQMGGAKPDAAHDEPSGPMQGMTARQSDDQQAMPMERAAPPGSQMPMQREAGDAAHGTAEQAMPAMQMDGAKPGADHDEKAAPAAGMAIDRPQQDQSPPMQGMDMAKPAGENGHGEPAAHGDEAEAAGGHGGGGGIELVAAGAPVDRTIEIKMTEWGYSPASVMVKPGEVVRLIVTNAGTIPHEFMIMTGPGMASVGYRIERADWNLTEHEAIYENPLAMPGDTFETVLKIEQAGMWMFMCMFPYHMRMGMMGMMMTEGMAGMNMGGMKM